MNDCITNTIPLRLLLEKAHKIYSDNVTAFKAIGNYEPPLENDVYFTMKYYRPMDNLGDCNYSVYELPNELVAIFSFRLPFSLN